MRLILVYDKDKAEVQLIRDQLSDLCDEEDISFFGAASLQELIKKINGEAEVAVYCDDFCMDSGDSIRYIRECCPESLVVVIVDAAVPPGCYVRPSILPVGLLMRPLTAKQIKEVLEEVFAMILQKLQQQMFNNEVFIVSTRDGISRVPYSQILYFEARNKKIVLCTGRSEIDFYATLENLSEKVPDYFLRCHKGYLVNKLLVNRIDISHGCLSLVGGFEVPISRSYRAAVKEALT